MKIVIVGHGESAFHAPPFEDCTVIRLATAGWEKPGRGCPFPGKRTDLLVSTQAKYKPDWLIVGESRLYCDRRLAPFKPRNPKASTGLCAAILARDKYPDDEIFVTGFDWTMHPETAGNYRHDARAESACIATLGILEYE